MANSWLNAFFDVNLFLFFDFIELAHKVFVGVVVKEGTTGAPFLSLDHFYYLFQ